MSSRVPAEIAAIVLSYRGRPTLVDAVRSLLAQDIRSEILVVNSGGGDVAAKLATAGLNVRVIDVEGRLFPGGARNLGIRETRAPYVAFLADDCLAPDGWLRSRVDAHRAGARAVASALVCHRPRSLIALAAHLSLFVRRMPRIPPSEALAYGASYDRRLFDEYGPFRDDLEGAEDTEFHRRLPDADKPVWCPAIQTVHCGVERLLPFLADQYRRGRRSAESWSRIGLMSRWKVARQAVRRLRFILYRAPCVVEPSQRWVAALALPFIALGGFIYAAGALHRGPRRRTTVQPDGGQA